MRESYHFSKEKGGRAHLNPNFNFLHYFLSCSHFWFATEQEVLLADWHDVWHSPQPPFLADSQRLRELKVLILFKGSTSFLNISKLFYIINHTLSIYYGAVNCCRL